MNMITPPALPILTKLGIEPSRLKFIQPHQRRTHCRAVVNWLTKHNPSSESSNLEQVRGYIEGFHHLCEIQEWERADTLISTELNTPTKEPIHYQLKRWGYNGSQY